MYKRLVAILASKWFFVAIICLFIVEATWIALSGRYPMAFDEDFHLGIIRLYAEQWSPFFASQPAGADTFGAVVRDPSYLQHYLLSFPYRLSDMWGNSDFINVLVLRFFSIGFMAVGLVLFRRLIGRLKASSAILNTVMLLFVLTPIVPFLAAQINYDAMLFPVTAAALLLAVGFGDRLRNGYFDTPRLIALVSVCMLASLIKYSFLPVFFGIVVCIGLELKRAVGRKGVSLRSLWRDARRELVTARRRVKYGIAALAIAASGLFVAMYGYNFVRYGTPVPECNQVLNAQRCTAYGAWYRNYQYAQSKQQVDANPIKFTKQWAGTYRNSTLFAVNGIYSGFIIGPPFPILDTAVLAMLWVGLAAVLFQLRRLWRQPVVRLSLCAIGIYVAALWVQNYGEYLNLGRHVAEHGRYLVILLIPAYAIVALAIRHLIGAHKRVLAACLVAVLLVFTQGGGTLTYIARSEPTWWWQDNPVATGLNWPVQKAVRPLLYGSDQPNIKPWEQPQR